MPLFHELRVNKEGSLLYGAVGQSLQLYNLNTGELIATYTVLQDEEEADKTKKQDQTPAPRHIHTLKLSKDEKYLIGSVNEGKRILVFDATNLELISKRSFPKRPSAVDTADDSTTLIVGDKFGDVYSAPLLSTDPVLKEGTDAESKIDPILGHVSMLVDLETISYNSKQYIVTADRDEHIRVTRYPQTYVIERWLFGHTEFVSCIEQIPWNTKQLISGGGDDFIALWDWTTGDLVQSIDLRPLIDSYLNSSHDPVKSSENSKREITVSQILLLADLEQILVLCENTNCVLQFGLDDSRSLAYVSTLVLDKPIINMAPATNKGYCFLSVEDTENPLRVAEVGSGSLAESETFNELQAKVAKQGPESTSEPVMLYNIRQLRKRGEF